MRFQEHWSQSVDDVPGRWRFSLPLSLCPPAQTSVNLCGGKGKRPEKGVARVSQKSNWNLRASLITGHLISFTFSVNKFLHICFSEMCGHYKFLFLYSFIWCARTEKHIMEGTYYCPDCPTTGCYPPRSGSRRLVVGPDRIYFPLIAYASSRPQLSFIHPPTGTRKQRNNYSVDEMKVGEIRREAIPVTHRESATRLRLNWASS